VYKIELIELLSNGLLHSGVVVWNVNGHGSPRGVNILVSVCVVEMYACCAFELNIKWVIGESIGPLPLGFHAAGEILVLGVAHRFMLGKLALLWGRNPIMRPKNKTKINLII
jgi:hypothetical protein